MTVTSDGTDFEKVPDSESRFGSHVRVLNSEDLDYSSEPGIHHSVMARKERVVD